MTLRETALANKSKQEMKLWTKVYINAKKDNSEAYCKMTADNAIEQFRSVFNEYGNVV